MKKIILVCMFLQVPFAALAQEFLTDVVETITGWTEEYELDLDLIPKPSPEEWSEFWAIVETSMQNESMEGLADLLPYAQVALGYLDQFEDAKPYADWLRNQMDYFSMADEIVREEQRMPPIPKPQPVTKPAPAPQPSIMRHKPKKPITILPPRVSVKSVPHQSSSSHKSVDVERWVKRLEKRPAPTASAKYVPILKPVFEKEGVPGELVWLAEVESSFNPKARSPVGAMGMYQFMPATAERFGLKIKPRDERLIPERSAYAAAKYLKFLHNKFHTWPLALAAYNAGEGRVGRLLKKHRGNSFSDISGYLPSETRMYVPKVAAVVKLREGSDLMGM